MAKPKKGDHTDPASEVPDLSAAVAADAERQADEADPASEVPDLSAAVAADAERQADEADAAREAEDDRKFRAHLLRIGGPEMVKAMTEATLELLDQLQRRAKLKSWRSMGEHVQRDIISRAEWAAKEMVAAAVSSVAGNAFPALPGGLKGVAIGDKGYKLTLETHVTDDRHRLALLSSVSKRVLVVLADPDVYAQHDPIQPMKDQPGLPGVPESISDPPDGEADAGDPGPTPLH